jgi:tetraacyldisaccharide 4'-kinase
LLKTVKLFLYPFSLLYRLIVFIRNKLYDWKVLKISTMNAAVISVGNLSAGGTGKTPMTEYIAEYFLRQNKSVAIVTKGYKRTHDDIQVVEIGYRDEEMKLTTENFGDESLLLLENLSKINVEPGKGLLIVSDNKRDGARLADRKFKPDVIILDDGYQHRAVSRNLDILMLTMNADKLLLPAGNLREPLRNMKRADLLILNKKFNSNHFNRLETTRPGIIVSMYEFDSFVSAAGNKLPSDILTDATHVIAFSGVAEPGSFKDLLNVLKVPVDNFLEYPDHHNYSVADIHNIIANFEESNSDFVLTTQKDMMRLKYSGSRSSAAEKLLYEMPLYCAKIRIRICRNKEILQEKLDKLQRTA